MILALVRAGRKVGVTATGHKVIGNLLDEVVRQSNAPDGARLAAKVSEEPDAAGPIRYFTDNTEPLAALESGEINVLGGTAWLWSRPEFAKSVDVLFIDEAGQVSLANALAMTPAANQGIPGKPAGRVTPAAVRMVGRRSTVETRSSRTWGTILPGQCRIRGIRRPPSKLVRLPRNRSAP